MEFLDRDRETIFALSTPPGRGGIAVLRVSGVHAAEFVRKNCGFLPENPESHRVYYGRFKNDRDETLDEVLLTFFAQGRSFTGQETVEISCHGSPVIVSALAEELVKSGCRPAARGEFTYRAFMSGRIDLVQAESVLSLIESRSKSAAKMASRHLQGELSKSYTQIENDLIWILANMEAAIDFSTEDITPYNGPQLLSVAQAALQRIQGLIDSFEKGRRLTEGLHLVLVGRPNVGKSSLLNALAQEERAIVTEIAGTTRDLVHAQLSIGGVAVQVTDTAGLQETDDVVEKIGIAKTYQALQEADLVFWLLDLSQNPADEPVLRGLDPLRTVLIGNKKDIARTSLEEHLGPNNGPAVSRFLGALEVSVKTGENLEKVVEIVQTQVKDVLLDDAPVVLHSRHTEKLTAAKQSLEKTMSLLAEDASPEFITFELQCGMLAVQELLGKSFDDQVMDRVFSEFCIGK